MEFLPGKINGKIGQHPAQVDIAHVKIDDVLIAKDTTCVDAIDADGMVFSATPSGAWMPSVIAGDTGIPLTQRAQQFVLVPGNPNELAGGKRPARHSQPHHRDPHLRRQTRPALESTPGGDNQEQALTQILLERARIRHERAERRRSAALPDPSSGLQLRQSRVEHRRPHAG